MKIVLILLILMLFRSFRGKTFENSIDFNVVWFIQVKKDDNNDELMMNKQNWSKNHAKLMMFNTFLFSTYIQHISNMVFEWIYR